MEEMEPKNDSQLTGDLARLAVDVGRVQDTLDALLRRASQSKQLPALRQGMEILRGSVAQLFERVAFLVPPSSLELKQQAKTVRFSEYFTDGLSAAFREKLALRDFSIKAEPAAMEKWPERAQDYAESDIAFSPYANHTNTNRDRIVGVGVDFGFIPLQPRRVTQNETGRKSVEPEQAKQLVEEVFKAWPKMREYVENGSKGLPFSRERLEAWAGSDLAEDRKKVVNILKDKYGVKMTEIVRLTPRERVDKILEFQEAEAKSWGFRVPEELKVQYPSYKREEGVLMTAKRICSCRFCLRDRVFVPSPAGRTVGSPDLVTPAAAAVFKKEIAKNLNVPEDLIFKPAPTFDIVRVKRDVVTRLKQETPVASSRGLAWCPKHHIGYAGYCKDCHPDGDPSVKLRVCAYCGKTAQGNFAIHRDGFGEGPEVDLCDGCGDCDETVLSCETIWEKFAKDGVCQ